MGEQHEPKGQHPEAECGEEGESAANEEVPGGNAYEARRRMPQTSQGSANGLRQLSFQTLEGVPQGPFVFAQ